MFAKFLVLTNGKLNFDYFGKNKVFYSHILAKKLQKKKKEKWRELNVSLFAQEVKSFFHEKGFLENILRVMVNFFSLDNGFSKNKFQYLITTLDLHLFAKDSKNRRNYEHLRIQGSQNSRLLARALTVQVSTLKVPTRNCQRAAAAAVQSSSAKRDK